MKPSALEIERRDWLALHQALLAEEQALIAGTADGLEALADTKQRALATLGEHVRARNAGLIARQLTADAKGMAHWLAEHGDAAERDAWAAIRTLEAETRAINQRNGGLIDQRLAATRQALNVLHGAAMKSGALYDARGQNQPPRGGRPLNAA